MYFAHLLKFLQTKQYLKLLEYKNLIAPLFSDPWYS